MSKRLDEAITLPEYDGLIIGDSPVADVFTVTIRKLAAEATLKRGTVLALSSRDGKCVILGTSAQGAVTAAEAVYALTEDSTITSGKTYYTRSGSAEAYTYSAVASPSAGSLSSYYEVTTPAVAAQDAETLKANCILCDDIVVGTAADVATLAYRTGKFNEGKFKVAEGYTFTANDREALRDGGILTETAVNY